MEKVIHSPIGDLLLQADEVGITGIRFSSSLSSSTDRQGAEFIAQATIELQEYFLKKRKTFTVPLHLKEGTAFQQAVWQTLRKIPYGQTKSYQDIAKECGNEKACRAVGMANHCNPIAIIVPCHRVIGKNKTLTGYAGGIEQKRYLLELEGSL